MTCGERQSHTETTSFVSHPILFFIYSLNLLPFFVTMHSQLAALLTDTNVSNYASRKAAIDKQFRRLLCQLKRNKHCVAIPISPSTRRPRTAWPRGLEMCVVDKASGATFGKLVPFKAMKALAIFCAVFRPGPWMLHEEAVYSHALETLVDSTTGKLRIRPTWWSKSRVVREFDMSVWDTDKKLVAHDPHSSYAQESQFAALHGQSLDYWLLRGFSEHAPVRVPEYLGAHVSKILTCEGNWAENWTEHFVGQWKSCAGAPLADGLRTFFWNLALVDVWLTSTLCCLAESYPAQVACVPDIAVWRANTSIGTFFGKTKTQAGGAECATRFAPQLGVLGKRLTRALPVLLTWTIRNRQQGLIEEVGPAIVRLREARRRQMIELGIWSPEKAKVCLSSVEEGGECNLPLNMWDGQTVAEKLLQSTTASPVETRAVVSRIGSEAARCTTVRATIRQKLVKLNAIQCTTREQQLQVRAEIKSLRKQFDAIGCIKRRACAHTAMIQHRFKQSKQ